MCFILRFYRHIVHSKYPWNPRNSYINHSSTLIDCYARISMTITLNLWQFKHIVAYDLNIVFNQSNLGQDVNENILLWSNYKEGWAVLIIQITLLKIFFTSPNLHPHSLPIEYNPYSLIHLYYYWSYKIG